MQLCNDLNVQLCLLKFLFYLPRTLTIILLVNPMRFQGMIYNVHPLFKLESYSMLLRDSFLFYYCSIMISILLLFYYHLYLGETKEIPEGFTNY